MQNVKNGFLSLKPWSRHSSLLLVAGIAYMIMGVVYVFHRPSETQAEALYFALNLMSLDWWGGGFIATGAIAVVSSVWPSWPSWPKSWGYAALTGWSAAWSAFYFSGALLTDAKVVYFGIAGVWALQAFVWWAVSGLVSPPEEDVT